MNAKMQLKRIYMKILKLGNEHHLNQFHEYVYILHDIKEQKHRNLEDLSMKLNTLG